MGDPRRRVPRTDVLLAHPRIAEAERALGRALVKSVIAEAQRRARAGEIAPEQVADHAVAALPATAASLRPVVNATGVVVHTNLGRAPLSQAALDAVMTAGGATNVEFAPANSTAQIFASSSYYGRNWTVYGQPQVVPFFLGPQGIVNAIDQNKGDPTGVVVLSSGWGAGQTSTALAIMQANHDTAMNNLKLVVLDNNTNRAGGGFWTTYWMFAPLLLTSAAPTPSDTTAPVVDTAYEYNINSDAPTYPLNLLADANSLVAYIYDYGGQATAPMPAEALQPVKPGAQHYHYVVASGGTVVQKVKVPGNITYVTFESDGLPLVQPLRILPGGNVLADALEPTLTVLVNSGYQDNSPIPQNPGVTRPVGVLPPASADIATAQQLPGAVAHGAQAAQKDLSPPSGLSGADALVTSPSPSAITTSRPNGANKVFPGSAKGMGAGVGSALGGVVSGLTGGAPKSAGPAGSSGSGGRSH